MIIGIMPYRKGTIVHNIVKEENNKFTYIARIKTK